MDIGAPGQATNQSPTLDGQPSMSDKLCGASQYSALDHVLAALLAVCAACILILVKPARFHPPDEQRSSNSATMPRQPPKADIYFIWKDGKAIAYGLNPYSRIHGGNMTRNDKYSTYLPGFFLLASTTVLAGVDSFDEFLPGWMVAQVVLTVGLGLLLFYRWRQNATVAVALLVPALWMFNRWTISVTVEGQIDILAALFAVLSIYLHKSRPVGSLLLFGVSLAIKQVAIFLLPVYLALAWDQQQPRKANLRNLVHTLGWIALIPAVVSLPFIIWDYLGFFKSILFSATRMAESHFRVRPVSALLELDGLAARIPMAGLFLLTYLAALQRRFSLATAAFVCSVIFIGFNAVLFSQYMVWGIALSLPLLEEVAFESKGSASRAHHSAP